MVTVILAGWNLQDVNHFLPFFLPFPPSSGTRNGSGEKEENESEQLRAITVSCKSLSKALILSYTRINKINKVSFKWEICNYFDSTDNTLYVC